MCEIQNTPEEPKALEFGEDQLADLSSIGAELFGDSSDPRSYAYVRHLERPDINWLRIFAYTLAPAVAAILLGILLAYFGASALLATAMPLAVLFVYALLMLKRACICAVKIYQRYAPREIREKCRFEPSCSQYMILAIEKYGLPKGLKKGISRLKRCNTDGGGYDLP